MHSAVSGWPKDTGTPETPSTRSSRLVKSRYVTRCCAPGIASPRYLYHSMRETRHSSFVRICIIGRGGILYAGQVTTSLPWPIYSSRRSSPYIRGDRSISRRNWSIDFFFSFFLLIFCDNRGKKRVEYYFYTRDSRFPRLITRTKWTRISWIPSIDFLSVETMSGRSYSEIRWRPTGEFRRNARINQQGSYSMPVRNSVCNL